MCIRQTPTPLCAHASIAPGAVSAPMSLIIAAPAAAAARITAGLRVSTASGIALGRQRLDERQHPVELFALGHGRGSGPRRFAADVDEIGAVVPHLPRVRERALPLDIAAAIGKGVRRDVEDAHHERARELEREAPAAKNRGGSTSAGNAPAARSGTWRPLGRQRTR